jgi:hypothetical protein
MTDRQTNTNNVGPMKIIAFEEHFKLPSIHQANKKANDPVELAYDTMIKSGRLVEDPKTGFPAGILDAAHARSAAPHPAKFRRFRDRSWLVRFRSPLPRQLSRHAPRLLLLKLPQAAVLVRQGTGPQPQTAA